MMNRLARAGAVVRLAVAAVLIAAAWLVLSPLAAPVALAAEPGGTTVSLAPLWSAVQPYIVDLASALVTLAVTVIATQVRRWTGVQIEAASRAALHSALQSGVDRAIGALGNAAGNLTIDMRSSVAAQAVTWAETSVPDAIRRLGATPEALTALAEAKLGAAIASSTTNVNAPPLPSALPTPPAGWMAQTAVSLAEGATSAR